MLKKWRTAEDVMRELESDPEWVAKRDAQDRRLEELDRIYSEDEAGLVEELRTLGYSVDSAWDFVNNVPHPILERPFIGPYEGAYPTLVRHLAIPHHPRIREGIVRALTVEDGGELVADALLREFRRETDAEMKWLFANALLVAMPRNRQREHPEIEQIYKARGRPGAA